MRKLWAWLSANNQSLSIFVASLSLTVAAISATASIWSNSSDRDYRLKRETLTFFLQYSPATRSRGVIARDQRLTQAFDRVLEIPDPVVIDLEKDDDGTNDAAIRSELVELVNYNEMLCLGRQRGVLDKTLFDLQFKAILTSDFSILKKFLEFTVRHRSASYPFWKEALKEWGIDASGLTRQ